MKRITFYENVQPKYSKNYLENKSIFKIFNTDFWLESPLNASFITLSKSL